MATPFSDQWFEHLADDLIPSSGTLDPVHPEYSLVHPKEAKAGAAREVAARKAEAAQKAQQAAYENQIKEVANSPWTTAADALASSFQNDLAAVAPDVSGASIPGAQAGAASSALASLGLSPGSNAGQWLAAQGQAAQATAAPVTAAMNAEAATYANAGGAISQAVQQWGQDNALTDITAPEQSWLSALASHVTSNLSYYGEVPSAALPALPYSIANALQKSGGYPGTSSAGTTPLQNITAGQGGSSQAVQNAQSLVGSGSVGTVPSVNAPVSSPTG
jgi:hypothetical protein